MISAIMTVTLIVILVTSVDTVIKFIPLAYS